MPTAKVIGEYYTVLLTDSIYARTPDRRGRYDTISDAVRAAMRITLDEGKGTRVLRVTEIEPTKVIGIFGDIFEDDCEIVTEKVTGEVDIPSPLSYNYDPRLSRYHPNNGWAIPETIEIGQ